ncbi:MAG: glycosyl hydrolase [Rikenellaceae bacterium]
MKRIKNIIAMATLAIVAVSCNTSQPVTRSSAEKLLDLINAGIEKGVVMLGHQDDPVYGHSWKYEANRSDVLEVVGDYPAVMGWEIGGIELGDAESLDGVPFNLIRDEIISQHKRGGINTVSWHTFNPFGGDSWDEGPGVVTSILKGGEHYDMFQAQLSIVADFFSTLKTDDGEAVPIIFRPWHEHDGSWFWWGDKWCTHAEYIELWDMTHDFMAARGLDNLVWCYMPMNGGDDKTPSVDKFDMLGIDEYQSKGNTEKYMQDMGSKIELLKKYSAKYDKPITISETGSEGLPSENWFTEVLLPSLEGAPVSYVLLWRNAWDKQEHFYCSYKGHSSEADFRKFVANPAIITARQVADIQK